ncbi:hypothetical protein GYMLUDRAFT_246156 [Collybiopsis luxurians FD-317 M1]|uniref:Unplaced genomic scaffold GYMLUscaffold_37, whole genome shotgun sequence n=1 Tax=Collybiopsis luxurians FD-317 M1 TaxID=944289 RepID=A0A0D0B555_9AGAR|nr:hypothetical protein GYMLUDRAFT_246156 [Collybiopsis luxurians FD-317 M1]
MRCSRRRRGNGGGLSGENEIGNESGIVWIRALGRIYSLATISASPPISNDPSPLHLCYLSATSINPRNRNGLTTHGRTGATRTGYAVPATNTGDPLRTFTQPASYNVDMGTSGTKIQARRPGPTSQSHNTRCSVRMDAKARSRRSAFNRRQRRQRMPPSAIGRQWIGERFGSDSTAENG